MEDKQVIDVQVVEEKQSIIVPITEIVVSVGVSMLCNSVLKEYVPEQDKKSKQILVGIGSWAITHFVTTTVTEKVTEDVDCKVRQAKQEFREIKQAFAEIKKRQEEGKNELGQNRG